MDITGYNHAAGSVILINAVDDFEVAGVQVLIKYDQAKCSKAAMPC